MAIFNNGLKLVAAGANPMELKRGIEKGVAAITERLSKNSRRVRGKEEIAQVGTVSSNGDEAIGELIAEAMEKVGKEGVITVEEAKSIETTLEVVEGMQFDRGFLSPYFVTDTPSLVDVGAPQLFSISTLRPRGPIVTLTAFASASTPR